MEPGGAYHQHTVGIEVTTYSLVPRLGLSSTPCTLHTDFGLMYFQWRRNKLLGGISWDRVNATSIEG